MSEVQISDIVFFFGAGASAPFGIPTMKQFVIDFEKLLTQSGNEDEQRTYTSIKETLEERLRKQVDLEAIFTVIDGILNYSPERLGLLSLYSATTFNYPDKTDVTVCKSLKEKFQKFVKEKCVIPEKSFEKIRKVYHDFFNRFALELEGGHSRHDDYAYRNDWAIFTTNYDLCLEYYWREVAGVNVNTGFQYNNVRKIDFLNPEMFLQKRIGMQLFKLHGSVSWLIEKRTGNVLEVMEKGKSYVGREYEGEVMLYPIAEKELYLNPYISMLLRLNQDLETKSVWVVIGYSFNDPIVREIFLRNSNKRKHLILVHPQANEVWARD